MKFKFEEHTNNQLSFLDKFITKISSSFLYQPFVKKPQFSYLLII